MFSTKRFVYIAFATYVIGSIQQVHSTPININDFGGDDTLVFEILHVDDDVTATLTNSVLTNFVVASRGFSFGLTSHDLTDLITFGENILNIKVINGPSGGWTIGWNLRLNDQILDSFTCGNWNIFGCNNNESAQGIVYDENLIINIAAPASIVTTEGTVPEPATLALFGIGLLGLGMMRRRSTKSKISP